MSTGAPPRTPAPLLAQFDPQLRSMIEDQEVVNLLKPLGLEVETDELGQLIELIETHRQS